MDPFQAYTASFKDRKPRLETLKNDTNNFLVLYPEWEEVTNVLGPGWKQDVKTSYVTNAETAEKEIKIVEKPWMVNEISDNYTLCRLAYEAYEKNYTLLATGCGAEMTDPMDFEEFYETLQSNDENETTQDYITNIYLHYAMMLVPAFADVAYDDDLDDPDLWDWDSDSDYGTQSFKLRLYFT